MNERERAMKQTVLIAICLWTQLVSCGIAKQADNPLPVAVGPFTDPLRLEFEGVTTFTAEEIRSALMRTPDFLMASHPAAPFGDYLPALERLVQAGYQQSGFPEAEVSVEFDQARQTITVTVAEGPRYMRGGIEVIGARTLPTEEFVKRMTEPRPKKSDGTKSEAPENQDTHDPIWEIGKPAPFSKSSQEQLTKGVSSILFELGYYFALFTAQVVPEPGTPSARLVVDITAEGSRRISEIIISGNEKNDREEILKYLGLEEGMQLDHDLLLKTNQRLWDAARFLDYSVVPEVDAEQAAMKLKIHVREYEPAPRLSEAFSPEEQLLLKVGDWLSNFRVRDEDLLLEISAEEVNVQMQVVISPTKGVLAVARLDGDTQDNGQQTAAILTPKKAAFFSPRAKSKFVFPDMSTKVMAQLSITPDPDPNDEAMFAIRPGVGIKDSKSGDSYDLELKLAPVFFVYCAHKDSIDLTHLLDQGIVSIDGDSNYRAEIDPQSGRLIKVVQSKRGTGQMALTMERGLFDELVETVEQGASDHTNRFVSGRALGSIVRYLSELPLVHVGLYQRYGAEFDCSEEAMGAAVPLLGRVLAAAVAPIDRWSSERAPRDDDQFVVPSSFAQTGASPMGMMISSIAAQVFGGCAELFPHGSWPWTLARETVFVAGGMGKYTEMELRRIYESPHTGPIGYLASAKLLTLVNKPLSRVFAARGLQRLSFSDFQKDWALVVTEDRLLFKCFESMAQAAGDLEGAEVDQLLAMFPREQHSFVRDCLQRLQEADTIPAHEALVSSLEVYWENTLKEEVRLALRRLVFPDRNARGLGRDANTHASTLPVTDTG